MSDHPICDPKDARCGCCAGLDSCRLWLLYGKKGHKVRALYSVDDYSGLLSFVGERVGSGASYLILSGAPESEGAQ